MKLIKWIIIIIRMNDGDKTNSILTLQSISISTSRTIGMCEVSVYDIYIWDDKSLDYR